MSRVWADYVLDYGIIIVIYQRTLLFIAECGTNVQVHMDVVKSTCRYAMQLSRHDQCGSSYLVFCVKFLAREGRT